MQRYRLPIPPRFGRVGRLSTLEATCRQTATEVTRAQQRAEASATVVAVEAAGLRDRLLPVWDAQRDAARGAARRPTR